MSDSQENPSRRTVVGGRHGSPTVTIALPFSSIHTSVDAEIRQAVADLATLVARLAEHSAAGNTIEIDLVHKAAEELAAQLSS